MLAFFVYGYILYADERFAPAVKRSWPLMLAATREQGLNGPVACVSEAVDRI
jgi:hypothetical protein